MAAQAGRDDASGSGDSRNGGLQGFPQAFRTRILHWIVGSIGDCQALMTFGDHSGPTRVAINLLCMELADAYGRNALVDPREMRGVANTPAAFDAERQLPEHLSRCSDFEVLDLIDASLQKIRERLNYETGWEGQQLRERVAERLNVICDEEGIGYRLVDDELIRFDDRVTQELAVQPALQLLHAPEFRNANSELRRALECYRAGHWRDSITNANAAFESVLKVATGQTGGTAGSLIATARSQGLIPPYMGGAAENLQKLMNVVPAARGQQGSSHGLGEGESQADEHLARLVLAAAASFIVFIGRPT